MLFRHDYNSPNVLHIINSAADVVDETLVEIVLTASRKFQENYVIRVFFLNSLIVSFKCEIQTIQQTRDVCQF